MELNQRLVTERYLKNPNVWKSKNIYLNNPCVKEEVSKEFKKKCFELNEREVQHIKFVRCR